MEKNGNQHNIKVAMITPSTIVARLSLALAIRRLNFSGSSVCLLRSFGLRLDFVFDRLLEILLFVNVFGVSKTFLESGEPTSTNSGLGVLEI